MTALRPGRASTGLVVVALLVSTVGDEVAMVALALRGADRTGLTSVVSAQMLAGLVPGIALGGWIGRIVDRFRPDAVLGVTLALECLIAAGAAALADGAVLLIATMLLLGALGAVAQTCVMALVPGLFPASEAQLRVNSLMESVRNAGYIIGPLLVGLLTAHGGTGLALAVDAGTFAFALLAVPVLGRWLALAAGDRTPTVDGGQRTAARAEGGLRLGLTLLWAGAQRRVTLATIVITIAATSVVNVLLPFFAHGIPGGMAVYGTLLATWSVGLVLGPLALRGPLGRRPTAVVAVAAAAIIGLSYLVTGLYPVIPLMLAAFLCGGMANAVQNVTLRTHVMADCAPNVRGRVGAAYGATLQSSVAVGFAFAGLVPAGWARWGILAGGGVAFLAGSFGWLRARTATASQQPARDPSVSAGQASEGATS
ncbi:MFS transporter [Streptomyces sp. 15-116A]|uniref:MFS transporter n=1 Tax=Streptomyces sp. 15-116A TaxID=2259035 RepID=UPI0021B2E3E1|nr:MFS transporter [Streptomyces sp. 15-116A]MCT7354336.1 MFS transporter [Streptomyces sp. 15-116A]